MSSPFLSYTSKERSEQDWILTTSWEQTTTPLRSINFWLWNYQDDTIWFYKNVKFKSRCSNSRKKCIIHYTNKNLTLFVLILLCLSICKSEMPIRLLCNYQSRLLCHSVPFKEPDVQTGQIWCESSGVEWNGLLSGNHRKIIQNIVCFFFTAN